MPNNTTDWFLNYAQGTLPSSFADIYNSGYEFELHKPEKYWQNENVKQAFGNDKNKFNDAYKAATENYNAYRNEEYDTMQTTQPLVFDTTWTRYYNMVNRAKQTAKLNLGKSDPYRRTTSVLGDWNQQSEAKYTEAELGQMNNWYMDSKTGKKVYVNEDKDDGITGAFDWFFKVKEPLVQARDENGNFKIDPETNSFYYETLGGRDHTKFEQRGDLLTIDNVLSDENSSINAIDFMDSDGYEKSLTGSILKYGTQAAALYFAPALTLGAYLAKDLTEIGLLAAKSAGWAMGQKEGDQSFLNDVAGRVAQYSLSSKSQHGKDNFFSVENLLGGVTDIAYQLGSQVSITKLPAQLKSMMNPKTYGAKAGETLQDVFTRLGKTDEYNNLINNGSQLSLLYNSTLAAKEIVDQATVAGVPEKDRAWIGLASTALFGALYKLSPFESWVTKGLGIDDIAPALRKGLQGKSDKIAKAFEAAATKQTIDEKVNTFTKFMQPVINDMKALLGNVGSNIGVKSVAGAGLAEAVEESSEVVFGEAIKQLYDGANSLGLTNGLKTKDYFKFDPKDFATEIGQSAFMGALGGAAFKGIQNYKDNKNSKDEAEESMWQYIASGREDVVMKQIEKMRSDGKFGSKKLSINLANDDKENPIWKAHEDSDKDSISQNDFIANQIKNDALRLIKLRDIYGINPNTKEYQDNPVLSNILNQNQDTIQQDLLDTLKIVDGKAQEIKKLEQQAATLEASEELNTINETLKVKKTEYAKSKALLNDILAYQKGEASKSLDDYMQLSFYQQNPSALKAFGVKTREDFVKGDGTVDEEAWADYRFNNRMLDVKKAYNDQKKFFTENDQGKSFADRLKTLDTQEAFDNYIDLKNLEKAIYQFNIRGGDEKTAIKKQIDEILNRVKYIPEYLKNELVALYEDNTQWYSDKFDQQGLLYTDFLNKSNLIDYLDESEGKLTLTDNKSAFSEIILNALGTSNLLSEDDFVNKYKDTFDLNQFTLPYQDIIATQPIYKELTSEKSVQYSVDDKDTPKLLSEKILRGLHKKIQEYKQTPEFSKYKDQFEAFDIQRKLNTKETKENEDPFGYLFKELDAALSEEFGKMYNAGFANYFNKVQNEGDKKPLDKVNELLSLVDKYRAFVHTAYNINPYINEYRQSSFGKQFLATAEEEPLFQFNPNSTDELYLAKLNDILSNLSMRETKLNLLKEILLANESKGLAYFKGLGAKQLALNVIALNKVLTVSNKEQILEKYSTLKKYHELVNDNPDVEVTSFQVTDEEQKDLYMQFADYAEELFKANTADPKFDDVDFTQEITLDDYSSKEYQYHLYNSLQRLRKQENGIHNFYRAYHEIKKGKVVSPTPEQEFVVMQAYSYFQAIYTGNASQQFNELEKKKKLYTDNNITYLTNTIFVDSPPGVGKTQMVIKTLRDLIKSTTTDIADEDILFATHNEEVGNVLRSSINSKGVITSYQDLIRKLGLSDDITSTQSRSYNLDKSYNAKARIDQPNPDSRFNTVPSTTSLPKVIFIDEITKMDLDLLNKLSNFAKDNGITLIVTGDSQQEGNLVKASFQANGETINTITKHDITSAYVEKTPRLRTVMRAKFTDLELSLANIREAVKKYSAFPNNIDFKSKKITDPSLKAGQLIIPTSGVSVNLSSYTFDGRVETGVKLAEGNTSKDRVKFIKDQIAKIDASSSDSFYIVTNKVTDHNDLDKYGDRILRYDQVQGTEADYYFFLDDDLTDDKFTNVTHGPIVFMNAFNMWASRAKKASIINVDQDQVEKMYKLKFEESAMTKKNVSVSLTAPESRELVDWSNTATKPFETRFENVSQLRKATSRPIAPVTNTSATNPPAQQLPVVFTGQDDDTIGDESEDLFDTIDTSNFLSNLLINTWVTTPVTTSTGNNLLIPTLNKIKNQFIYGTDENVKFTELYIAPIQTSVNIAKIPSGSKRESIKQDNPGIFVKVVLNQGEVTEQSFDLLVGQIQQINNTDLSKAPLKNTINDFIKKLNDQLKASNNKISLDVNKFRNNINKVAKGRLISTKNTLVDISEVKANVEKSGGGISRPFIIKHRSEGTFLSNKIGRVAMIYSFNPKLANILKTASEEEITNILNTQNNRDFGVILINQERTSFVDMFEEFNKLTGTTDDIDADVDLDVLPNLLKEDSFDVDFFDGVREDNTKDDSEEMRKKNAAVVAFLDERIHDSAKRLMAVKWFESIKANNPNTAEFFKDIYTGAHNPDSFIRKSLYGLGYIPLFRENNILFKRVTSNKENGKLEYTIDNNELTIDQVKQELATSARPRRKIYTSAIFNNINNNKLESFASSQDLAQSIFGTNADYYVNLKSRDKKVDRSKPVSVYFLQDERNLKTNIEDVNIPSIFVNMNEILPEITKQQPVAKQEAVVKKEPVAPQPTPVGDINSNDDLMDQILDILTNDPNLQELRDVDPNVGTTIKDILNKPGMSMDKFTNSGSSAPNIALMDSEQFANLIENFFKCKP